MRTWKQWKENPKEQGFWNFIVAMFCVLIASIVNCVASEQFWNNGYIAILALLVTWGIFILVIGLIFGKKQKGLQ